MIKVSRWIASVLSASALLLVCAPSRAEASAFVIRIDDLLGNLHVTLLLDGFTNDQFDVPGESWITDVPLDGDHGTPLRTLDSSFNIRANILESPGGPLSDTLWVQGVQGAHTFHIEFRSDVDGVPLAPLGDPTLTLVENGDWQSVFAAPFHITEFNLAGQPTGATDTGDVQFRSDVSENDSVPEPASLALVGTGLVAAISRLRQGRARDRRA
jgi:hypothetical protein